MYKFIKISSVTFYFNILLFILIRIKDIYYH